MNNDNKYSNENKYIQKLVHVLKTKPNAIPINPIMKISKSSKPPSLISLGLEGGFVKTYKRSWDK